MNDLAQMGEGGLLNDVAITSGCYFGLIPQTLINNGHKAAVQVARSLAAAWCPNVFIEVQHHNTPHERVGRHHFVRGVVRRCQRGWLAGGGYPRQPLLRHGRPGVHDFMRRIALAGSDDYAYPGDSYHLADTEFVKDHFATSKKMRSIWNESLDSCDYLLNKNMVEFPALDKYKFQVPVLSNSAQTDVRRQCIRTLRLRVPVAEREPYMERLEQELSVIKDTGFASYFLLVAEIVGWCRTNDVYVSTRGSANGSLVCWLMSITNVDPLRWNLLLSDSSLVTVASRQTLISTSKTHAVTM